METIINCITIDREIARKRAEDESKRFDLKQHADKLIQRFEKLNESHAKRAIWELFQNAIDLSEDCDIIIEYNEDSLIFKHNGKPFTTETLSCLIKQVSSKNVLSNEDEVGQYGTGFISTHSFGKKILVSGSLKEGDFYIPFKNFEIDRIADKADPELIEKLIIQQEYVYDLVNNGDLKVEREQYTSFAYQTTSQLEKQNAKIAMESLNVILPYVMMINKKLKQVTVYEKSGFETIYSKGDISLFDDITVTTIRINHSSKRIFSIVSDDSDLIIILPLSDQNQSILFEESLSKLFLFYPLIGTENFGFNYLVHSKRFAPTEPRDGIHLKSKNEQLQEKEFNNRAIMELASEMIFKFVEKYALNIQNPIYLAYINFNNSSTNILLAEYFKEFKNRWVERFNKIPLVETNIGRLKVNETRFLAKELLIEKDYFDSIYSISELFWDNIPKKEVAINWTENVSNWEDDNTSFIKILDIVLEIQKVANLDYFSNQKHLKQFYEYIIKYSNCELFNQYKILPNIKNEFRFQSQLNSFLNIDNILIKIADEIIPDIPKRFIKPDFDFNLGFEPYDRKMFSRDINSKITELNKSINEETLLSPKILNALLEYCKIFPSLDNTGTRGQLIKLMSNYYNVDSTFVNLPSIINQEIDWLQPLKCLLRSFIWDLNLKDQIWIDEHKSFLYNVLSTIYNYYEFDDIVQTLPIYPNQLFKLCKQNELKIDGDIPDELKDLYDTIIQPTKPIRNNLLLDGLSNLLKNGETKFPKNIGDDIDKAFQDAMSYSEINQHPHKKHILWIIKKISDDNKWSKYFPSIEDKKAIIMMARISDTESKNDLFSIIGLDKNKIALLGELSKDVDLERIIVLGKIAIEEEKRNKADFQFKYEIGTLIENLIREKIGADLTSLQILVRDEQGGQDIVVEYDNSIVYYIEVKSRWDSRSSITMSPLQMRNAVINKDKYSLCCVDMTDYKNGEDDRYNVTDINEIINRINVLNDIGVRIEPLLDGILAVKDFENEISLDGDYRGRIPQSIVKMGTSLEHFVNSLIDMIGAK